MAHIRLGVEQAAADPKSVLLFSGGKTRASAGPRAEAEGYWLVAEANDWFGFPEVRRRAFTEVSGMGWEVRSVCSFHGGSSWRLLCHCHWRDYYKGTPVSPHPPFMLLGPNRRRLGTVLKTCCLVCADTTS